MNVFLEYDWNSSDVDAHRRGLTDIEWARKQGQGDPIHKVGDKVFFKVGGCGVVGEVKKPQSGWPASYSINPIKGESFHPHNVVAWHYEGDLLA